MKTMNVKGKITCAQAAQLLGVSPRALKRWRRDRRGPAFFNPKPGGPFYLLSDIIRFLMIQTR